MRKVLLVLFLAPTAHAQGVLDRWIFTQTAPTGSCNPSQAWVVEPGGTLYTCQNGVPTIAGGGGGGTGTVTSVHIAGTANQISVTGTCTITTSGTCTASIPSNAVLPGNPQAAGQLAATDISQNLATTAFVKAQIGALNPAVAVQAATITVLPFTPTYNNGTAGVGATLTAGSNGTLMIDGYTVLLNDRVLINNQASAFQNGVYTLTTLGTGGVPYVLTRATDLNTVAEINTSGALPVLNGTVNNNTLWVLNVAISAIGTPNAINYSLGAATPFPALTITNASSTGTTINTLSKLTGAPSTAVINNTADTTGAIGICVANCGTTGAAIIQESGISGCVFDGATTANDFVQISATTNGDCHDSGATFPTSGEVVGRVLTTNAGAGTYAVLLFSPDIAVAGKANPANEVTTTFSATPTFTCGSTAAGTVSSFNLSTALTANITSSTLASCTPGQTLNFDFVQDGTGGRTVVMPTGFDAISISPTASIHTKCSYWWDGTNGKLGTCVSNDIPTLIQGVERAAPGTPASAAFSCWPDSTSHDGLECKNNGSTTVYHMFASPVTVATGGTGLTTATAHAVLLGEGTSAFGFATIGTAGRLLIDQGSGADAAFEAMSGDCTLASNGAITCTKTNGNTPTITVGNGTITLATSAISSGTCTAAQTVTITGTATTDNVMVDFNADPTGTTGWAPSTNGGLFLYKYPTLNTANVKVCNNSGSSITPGAALTLNVRVVR